MDLAEYRAVLDREVMRVRDLRSIDYRGWFDLWHTHVDWRGTGNESPAHRHAQLAALKDLHDAVAERLRDRVTPYQFFVTIHPESSGDDAVYIHTPNENETPFPTDMGVDDWNCESPEWIASVFSPSAWRIGRGAFQQNAYYVLENRSGRQVPVGLPPA